MGIAYERDKINPLNVIKGVGTEFYTMPFDGFKLGGNIYGVLGNRITQSLLGIEYNSKEGINVNINLREGFLKIGVDYSLKNGLGGDFGVTSFTKLPKNYYISCPINFHQISGGGCYASN